MNTEPWPAVSQGEKHIANTSMEAAHVDVVFWPVVFRIICASVTVIKMLCRINTSVK